MFKEIDWEQVVDGIIYSSGLTGVALAKQMDCSPAYISKLYSGLNGEPRYSFGVKLLSIYRRRRRYMNKSLYPKL